MTTEDWDDCPQGLVCQMAQQLHRQRRRQQASTAAYCGALLLLIAAGWVGVRAWGGGETLKSLSCSEVVQLVEPYRAGTLDAATRELVDEHLTHCPGCRRHFHPSPPQVQHVPINAPQLASR